MSKLLGWLIGFSLGAALGAALVMLFSPVSGTEVINGVKAHYQNSIQAGHLAALKRRQELEAQLDQMRAKRGLKPYDPSTLKL